MRNRYFMLHGPDRILNAATVVKEVSTAFEHYTLCKLPDSELTLPEGKPIASVGGELRIEYRTAEEFRIACASIIFTDYSGGSEIAFANAYEKFTTNDKNEARKIRQAILAWSARNAGDWTPEDHRTIWPFYDSINQRLSDGAIVPSEALVYILRQDTGDQIGGRDMSSLNQLLEDMLQAVFDKYPRRN